MGTAAPESLDIANSLSELNVHLESMYCGLLPDIRLPWEERQATEYLFIHIDDLMLSMFYGFVAYKLGMATAPDSDTADDFHDLNAAMAMARREILRRAENEEQGQLF